MDYVILKPLKPRKKKKVVGIFTVSAVAVKTITKLIIFSWFTNTDQRHVSTYRKEKIKIYTWESWNQHNISCCECKYLPWVSSPPQIWLWKCNWTRWGKASPAEREGGGREKKSKIMERVESEKLEFCQCCENICLWTNMEVINT